MEYFTVIESVDCFTSYQTSTIGISADIKLMEELFNSHECEEDVMDTTIQLQKIVTDSKGKIVSRELLSERRPVRTNTCDDETTEE